MRSPSAPAELQQEEGAVILQGCTAAHKGAFQLCNITFLLGFFFTLFVRFGEVKGKELNLFLSSSMKYSREISYLCFWFFAEPLRGDFCAWILAFRGKQNGNLSLRGSTS